MPRHARLGYRPHLTFAIYESIERELLERTVVEVFADQAPLRIVFDGIRAFDATPLVLWASPADSAQLHALHAAIHARIDPARCHELYRPDGWVPHCTLGSSVLDERRHEALAFAAEVKAPFEVVFDSADWHLSAGGSHRRP